MVSVIVPVYNTEKFLRECVESICNQTYKNLEIILVNDGSTDNSVELCNSLAKEDNRIIVIHKENGGSTSARNAGLKVSQGEYIGFVDSDDWIEPQMYEVLLERCVSDNAEMAVCTRYINHDKSNYIDKLCIAEGSYTKLDSEKTIIKNLFYSEDYRGKGITDSLCDKLFSKDLIFRHQFKIHEKTKYAEDVICAYSCLLDAEKVSFIDRPFYHYRMQERSLTHSVDDTYFEKISIFYQQMKKEFMAHPDSEILMPRLKKYMLNNILKGINYIFGFSSGPIIPIYIPPYKLLKDKKVQSLILYGAGNVGKDFYKGFQDTCFIEVAGWVDKQYENYRSQGFSVESIHAVLNRKYDCILLAIENEELVGKITQDLIDLGVEKDKILWESPKKIINDLEDMV